MLVWALGLLFSGDLAAVELWREDFDDPRYFDEQGEPSDALLSEFGGWHFFDLNEPNENATWTLGNPGGRRPPPDERGRPSSGFFLTSDSDAQDGMNLAGSGMSHDAWSPPIDCSESTTVWLHFNCTAQLDNGGDAVFDVDISDDDGESWSNVFRRVAPGRSLPPVSTTGNADGFFGRVDLDVSGLAAGQVIRIRWRHFEPTFDWWVAIDDIVLDDVAPARPGSVSLLEMEDFRNGIPASWEVRSLRAPPNRGAETWSSIDKGQRYRAGRVSGRGVNRINHPSPEGEFAILESFTDPDPSEDEFLITPLIDCSCAEEVILEFRSETIVSDDALQEVLLSIDGGQTFLPEPVFSYSAGAGSESGEEPFFAKRVLRVPDALEESEVAFAFHYASDGNAWWWAVDDVEVSAIDVDGDCRGITCEQRDFRVETYDSESNTVRLTWNSLAGDVRHRLWANGELLINGIGGGADTYVDRSPPATETVVYRLASFAGEVLRTDCETLPIAARRCPKNLQCCFDEDTGVVALRWETAVNLPVDLLELRRNGELLTTLEVDSGNFFDVERPGPGTTVWELDAVDLPEGFCDELPLRCALVVEGDGVLFHEDFDCLENDGEVEAAGWMLVDSGDPVELSTWTIDNPSYRRNPPTEDGSPSRGRFLISDSDHGGGKEANLPGSGASHDLWSPEIDCSTSDTVWLHLGLSAQLNDNGSAVCDIDVSSDGGENWATVFRRIAPARDLPPLPDEATVDGFFGRLHLDITEQAAGESAVRFRVRHFEPSFDWWVAIDDVQVDERPVSPGSVSVLERTEFDAGIPETWSLRTSNEDGQWATGDPCGVVGVGNTQLHHFADGGFAGVCGLADDEYLLTPVLDCRDLQAVFLGFASAIHAGGPVAEVLVSIDGGETFSVDPVFRYDSDSLLQAFEDPLFGEYLLPVPQAAGAEGVVFAFHYRVLDDPRGWWGIDAVEVTGIERDLSTVRWVRGDADSSGDVSLSDGIVILQHLFLGGDRVVCADAADSDDSGEIVVNDAVALFNWLFRGGPGLAAPAAMTGIYGAEDCGQDVTEDDLDCRQASETCSAE